MQDVFYDDTPKADSPAGVGYWLAQALKWGGAALSLALVATIIIWAYRLGVRDARDIPVIRALDTPVRVQPADPGGTVQPHQGLEVNEILAGSEAQTPTQTSLAPGGGTLLNDEDQPIGAEDTQIASLARQAVDEVGEGGPDAALPLISEEDAQAQQVLQQIARLPTSDTRPRPRPGARTAPAAEPSQVVVGVEASIDEIVPGTRLIQLGAFDTRNEASTHWRAIVGDHGDLLSLKRQVVQEAVSNGRTFYRLRVLGFDGTNDQRAMCEALRARAVDCIPVTVR